MQIGKKDVIWNFVATTMRVASGLIVLPLVLRKLPTQEVGLWNIFIAIGSLAALLDFGFSNSFSRNVTYIFSGVKVLKATGYNAVNEDKTIDYGLLKSVISAMRRYYGILALIFLVILFLISPFYLTSILKNYSGDVKEVWISWFIYGILVAYQLYTYYYNSLLVGRGMVKRSMQILIISQLSRILITVFFLIAGFGLISLVIGQFVSDIVNRTLSYLIFYDKTMKLNLNVGNQILVKDVMKIMTPNAIKIGVTTIGSFFANKAIVLITPLFLPLNDIAIYGTTKQMIDLIVSLGGIWFATYYPKITLHRVNENYNQLKRMYIKSKLSLIVVFLFCGLGLIFIVPEFLILIHSKTHLMSSAMITLFLVIAFLESNQGMSGGILLTKNEVPFMKASLFTGVFTIVLLIAFFKLTAFGLWGLLIAPGIAQLAYQNWKWPLLVKIELGIRLEDFYNFFKKN